MEKPGTALFAEPPGGEIRSGADACGDSPFDSAGAVASRAHWRSLRFFDPPLAGGGVGATIRLDVPGVAARPRRSLRAFFRRRPHTSIGSVVPCCRSDLVRQWSYALSLRALRERVCYR